MDKNKIKQSDYLDIVYEGKNKKYGGYELRKNYTKRLITGSAIAFLLLGGIFASTLIESKEIEEEILVNTEDVVITNIEPPELKENQPKPIKPPSVPPPPKPTFKLSKPVIEPNKDVKKEDKITDLDKRDDKSTAGTVVNDGPDTDPDGAPPGFNFGNGNEPGPPTPKVEDEKPKGPERTVDKKAVAPVDVNSFLNKNVVFPEMMRAEGKSGVVNVQFIVKVDGTITDIKALRSPHKLFSDEAIKAIKLLQKQGKWTPAEKNGKPVDSYHTIPVRFQLQ